jgi:hypothetical protein
MGTISDKLMRIINTKEDIRQALISKGYDVPTSIPFKEYAKMILDLPCNADSFPDIEGIVARYSASGLTNEQMAANPVWVDKTGNGYDLQLKNFSWGGMSGVGGYVDNWNSSADWAINSYWVNSHTDHKLQFITASSVVQARSNNIYNAENVYKNILNVNGLTEAVNKGSVKSLRIIATDPITSKAIKTFSFETDGVIQISFDDVLQDYYVDYFLYGSDTKDIDITIEQLPLYPGFILGDGVDDFAVTEKELNFEDTYTVYTAFIPFQDDPTRNMILCGADSKKTFSMQYSSLVYVSFIAGNNYYINADFVNGLNLFACKRNGNNICIKNLLTNKVVTGTCGDWVENAGPYYLWKNATYASFAKAAIAGQTICNGYFSTDEDDEKVLDWYKKQYPWLFPDQAWTVVGKTNEDEDRATIANITGNGNDLVLSNFGFAEGSGYGLYAYNFNSFNLRDNVVKPTDVKKDSFRMIGTGNSNNVLILLNESDSADWKIRITGMKDGDHLLAGNANKSGDYIKITKDGVYTFQKQYAANATNGIWYNSSQEVDVLVEQIPEYEGYLVTDGVDDIASSNTVVYEADFTFIGEWKFIQKDDTVAGINSSSHLYIQNRYNRGATVMINSTFENKKNITDYMTFKAITSKGKGYDENWNEVDLLYGDGNKGTSGVNIGGQGGTEFCHMIFKNMALYMNKVFTKDECIKAYNYLQTLKAK